MRRLLVDPAERPAFHGRHCRHPGLLDPRHPCVKITTYHGEHRKMPPGFPAVSLPGFRLEV
jgi:hypothetical protein